MIRKVTKSQSHEVAEFTSPLTPLLKVEGNNDLNFNIPSVKSVLNPWNYKNELVVA